MIADEYQVYQVPFACYLVPVLAIKRLIEWSIDWLIDRLIDRSIDWSIDWSIDRLIDPLFIILFCFTKGYAMLGRALLVSRSTKWGIRYGLYFSFVYQAYELLTVHFFTHYLTTMCISTHNLTTFSTHNLTTFSVYLVNRWQRVRCDLAL